MRKSGIIRFICDMGIVIFLLGFALALCWYLGGSFETAPTEEQQEKARIAAMLWMLSSGALCMACAWIRMKAVRQQKGGKRAEGKL